MNTNKNSYIIIYSAILVVVVAFLLAFVYAALKPQQDINVALDKKKQILASLNIRNLSDTEAAAKYTEVVECDEIIDTNATIINKGEKGGEKAGFKLNSADLKDGKLAVYVCNVDGEKKYVIPVYGMGLWGSIWGYIALDADKNTIFGAYFDHQGETAGLGAEIKDSKAWQDRFKGKKIFSADGEAVVIAVKKSSDVKNPASEVDAVTGATLTSDGVSLMLQECFSKYVTFLKK